MHTKTLTVLMSLAVASLPLATQAAFAAEATSAPAAQVSMRHATPFTIRNLTIGEGAPKIIVPTTGKTDAEVLAQASAIAANPAVDLIEYRIDYLDFATDPAKIAALGEQVKQAVHGKPLLLTFRTKGEGGARAISDEAYGQLYLNLLKSGFMDLIDVEMFRDPKVVKEVVDAAHKQGVKVIMSSHDFHATPSVQEIVARLRKQDTLGADVLKIAVMPHNPGDVLKLLDASNQIRSTYSTKPLLVMSMGGLGAVTRMDGEVFGSDLTFGSLGVASAPGQVDVQSLKQSLQTIHNSITGGK